jgi:hypothetical protein
VSGPTYHGVPVPGDIWLSWNDPNDDEASAWRRGVVDAKSPRSRVDAAERERLEKLAAERDAAEQAAWQEEHDRKMTRYTATIRKNT